MNAYDLIALLFTLLGGILVLTLPRKWAIAPLFVVSIFIPLGQYVLVGGLHFYMSRIIILFGLLRMIFGPASLHTKLNAIDKVMILWVVVDAVAKILCWQTTDVVVNRLGFSYNALGVYFLTRHFVRDMEDLNRLVKMFGYIAMSVALLMLMEKTTGRNAFAVFGGVPLISEVRLGRIRAQGPFEHSIMAGSFGAALMPLLVSLAWGTRKHRSLAFLGVAAATAITVLASSSGPILSYAAGVVALFMWPLRKSMRVVRWGLVCGLAALQLVMKAPVWALLMRISVVDGSTAYHRFVLVDQFIRRFDEWWLVGIKNTEGWSEKFMVLHDITNHYVGIGVEGGLLALTLFIVLLALCFRGVGDARRTFQGQPALERLCWAFGAGLFANVVAFMGVSYFDQITILWYAFLAMLSRLAMLAKVPAAAGSPEPASSRRAFSGLAAAGQGFRPTLARYQRALP